MAQPLFSNPKAKALATGKPLSGVGRGVARRRPDDQYCPCAGFAAVVACRV